MQQTPLTIAVDLRPLQGPSGKRGIGVYIRNLIYNLSLIDKVNRYIFVYYKSLPKPEFSVSDDFSYNELILPSVGKPFSKINALAEFFTLSRHISKITPHVIHITSPMELDMNYALGGLNCRVAATVHDLTPYIFRDTIFKGKRRLLLPLYMTLLKNLNKTNRIISISENTKQDLMRIAGIDNNKITVIHSGAPSIEKSPSSVNCEKYGDYIIFAGDASPQKNVDIIAKALPAVSKETGRKINLVIAGRVNDVDKERILNISHSNENCGEIIFTGYISSGDLYTLYSEALCAVFPSFYEGFGLPCLEAMACGVPLAASNVSSIPEVAGDAGIFIDPSDLKGWVKAVSRIINNPQEAASLVEKGRKRLEHFNWKETALKTLQVYNAVAGRE